MNRPTPNPSGGGESMSRHACEFPSWEGPGVGRFMGSLHDFRIAHRNHEPVPLNRPPGTFSPTGGEGRDEGDTVHGEPPFVFPHALGP